MGTRRKQRTWAKRKQVEADMKYKGTKKEEQGDTWARKEHMDT